MNFAEPFNCIPLHTTKAKSNNSFKIGTSLSKQTTVVWPNSVVYFRGSRKMNELHVFQIIIICNLSIEFFTYQMTVSLHTLISLFYSLLQHHCIEFYLVHSQCLIILVVWMDKCCALKYLSESLSLSYLLIFSFLSLNKACYSTLEYIIFMWACKFIKCQTLLR